ncbi:MAG: TonB-dependent receptor [Gammaproteobacteria bacterium]|nr:TonB-dependent receptor [Gammaproteobacteria bacterium]
MNNSRYPLILTQFSVAALMAGLAASPVRAQESADSSVEEFVVVSKFIPDEKRSTSEISSLLDAEDFSIVPESDVAGVLKRLPGLTLVGGRFVYVRGLGQRYSTALMDGTNLPSPEPLTRAVPLDILPTQILESALVQKTYSPQFPANFGGGVIELRTRAIPLERFFEFSVSGEINTETTGKDGLGFVNGDLDLLGIDDGTRKLPSVLTDDPTFQNLSIADATEAIKSVPNAHSIEREPNTAPGYSLKFAYGDNFLLQGDRSLGVLLALDYGVDFQTSNGERNRPGIIGPNQVSSVQGQFFNKEFCADSDLSGFTLPQEIIDDCGVRRTEWEVGLNGFLSLGLELDDNNTIKLTNMLLRQTTRESIIQQGIDLNYDLVNRTRSEWIERQTVFTQLSGEHFIDSESAVFTAPVEFRWRAAYSNVQRDVLLRRSLEFKWRQNLEKFELLTFDGNQTGQGELTDDNYDLGVDFVLPMMFADHDVTVKFGGAYLDQSRESSYARFRFNIPAAGYDRTTLPELLFHPVNLGPGMITLDTLTEASDDFSSSMRVYGAYLSGEIQLTDELRFSAGMRYEDSRQLTATVVPSRLDGLVNPLTGQVLQGGTPLSPTLNAEFLLPAATLTWEFTDNMQLRGGFSQTLTRPDLREFSLAAFVDPDRDDIIRGNPALTITELDNYDVRWEWYYSRNQTFSLGAFYKEIKNPIERTIQIFGNQTFFSFINGDNAKVKGLEAEAETYLPFNEWFEAPFFQTRDVFVKFNVAYVDSKVTLDFSSQQAQGATTPTNAERRLQNQSQWMINAQVGYENLENDEKLALLFNFADERIAEVGVNNQPDVFEEPPVLLDFVYQRGFDFHGWPMTVKFEATNLLNDNTYLRQGGVTFERFSIGRSFSLGLTVRK